MLRLALVQCYDMILFCAMTFFLRADDGVPNSKVSLVLCQACDFLACAFLNKWVQTWHSYGCMPDILTNTHEYILPSARPLTPLQHKPHRPSENEGDLGDRRKLEHQTVRTGLRKY